MSNNVNYRLIAIQVGDVLKYDTSVNEINRAADSIFKFEKEQFPCKSITSSRAQEIHDWILTLAKQEMNAEERNQKLIEFLKLITPVNKIQEIESILSKGGVYKSFTDESIKEFYSRNYHPEINKHCLQLYKQQNYFHAVFEAAKVYNKLVKEKSKSGNDGVKLMMEVWPCKGVLKVTECKSETDENVQEGLKFLSAGLMRAIRNPTAHEPALHWPISKEDCLDLLSFISFLLRKLDQAV